ncbi:unannotated protein [freshwater metagenome]|uniref:Unannotated protein n=1 Tax=freshwater metagenome TaxID=449393 RepID=A0A6J6D4J7_9ZZZZ
MADIADDGLMLHLGHVFGGDDVEVASGSHVNVDDVEYVFKTSDLIALHRRLQRTDRIDLGDDDSRALAAQRRCATLPNVAVTAYQSDLSTDHDIGGSVKAVDKTVTASVKIVELRLGY